ncbi:YdgA family protein [Aeromonas veronii]|nr:YdgA family protein [Aeromonas veronii]
MKKIVALAVGAALVGGGLAACWYTGNSFDNIMAEQIAKVEQETGIDMQWQPGSSNLFTRDGILKIVVTPEELATIDSELEGSQPIELQLVVKSRILPLYIKSHLLLDTHNGTMAPVFTALGMEQWQLGLESVTSLWTQGNSSRFWANEFKVKQGLDEFHFLPLSGEFHGNLEGNGHITMAWQGMTVHEEQSKMDLVLADMKGSADIAEISGVILSPQSEMTLSALTVQLPDSVKVALQGMTTETQLTGDDAQTLSSSYQMKIAKLDLENETDTLAVTDSKLALNLNGLDLEGYQGLQAAGGKGVEDAAIQQALDKMLKRGATLELADLSAKLNGEAVTMKGDVKLASTSLEQLFNSEAGMQALSGVLHANLSDKLGKAVPQLAPMLDQLTLMGYLKADKQALTSELKLEKGAVTVNDLPL